MRELSVSIIKGPKKDSTVHEYASILVVCSVLHLYTVRKQVR